MAPPAGMKAEFWAREIHKAVGRPTALGFTKFGVERAVRYFPGLTIFTSREEERSAIAKLPLKHDFLARLKVKTIGEFLALPPAGVLERFGPEALRFHRLASGELELPFTPTPEILPLSRVMIFETPEENRERLLFAIKSMLDPMLGELRDRGEALARLEINRLPIAPAAPTNDARLIYDLVRLHLETLLAPVDEIAIVAHSERNDRDQISLARRKRDLVAAEEALARIRAQFGDVVVKAELRDEYLPEKRFEWKPCDSVRFPNPIATAHQKVRRIHPPRPLQNLSFILPPSFLINNWRPVYSRRYHFTSDGRWVFFDGHRWFEHGRIE